ncbi:ATP-binding protein [Streptomyces sp. NPDC050529]|uniref:ATP-binding protein n=1 Tax=unclassified Streptomyces TaxID=2593676 RepID=UPI002DDA2E92|nr:ATP-binding protein [Streptomyces sp. NBC_01022]WRZ85936.1 ATP-binding protein [Streptomyces sp. NBC_01022]
MKGALRCLPALAPAGPQPPAADNLSYSFALPGGAFCAGLARRAVDELLTRHGLAELAETAVLATSELVAAAYRFTPDREMLLRVHWQFDALRITLYDQHPVHASPEKSEECREHRSASMWLLAAAVDAHGGDWGLAPALTASGGSKTWALLHR